jgi:hypothetical protein
MMNKHEGRCIGGPDNGMMMAHWSKSKEFFSPMIPLSVSADPPVIPVKIGEYRLNDFGQWHWWETEEGRALAILNKVEENRE